MCHVTMAIVYMLLVAKALESDRPRFDAGSSANDLQVLGQFTPKPQFSDMRGRTNTTFAHCCSKD